ncbi:MAG: hypothetical protein FWG40_12535 [Peptococcaceae bacterium]|nr:hypothetical protein [Peptococcaceae bacterium]
MVTVEVNGIRKEYRDHDGTPFIDSIDLRWYVLPIEFADDFDLSIYPKPGSIIVQYESARSDAGEMSRFLQSACRDYKTVIEIAVHERLVTVYNVDGQVYYEFNDEFVWDNYGSHWTGRVVLTEVDGDMKLFIRRTDIHGISVPFGFFDPDLFETLFPTGWVGVAFSFYHYRSSNIPSSLDDRRGDMERIATYYALSANSEKAGLVILKYLGYFESLETGPPKTSFTNGELDAIAGRWSGSSGRGKFCNEIEAHADLLLNNDARAQACHFAMTVFPGGRTEEEYFNSVGCADLAEGDNGIDKFWMDFLW